MLTKTLHIILQSIHGRCLPENRCPPLTFIGTALVTSPYTSDEGSSVNITCKRGHRFVDGSSRKSILCSENEETESNSWQLGKFDKCYSELVSVWKSSLFLVISHSRILSYSIIIIIIIIKTIIAIIIMIIIIITIIIIMMVIIE